MTIMVGVNDRDGEGKVRRAWAPDVAGTLADPTTATLESQPLQLPASEGTNSAKIMQQQVYCTAPQTYWGLQA